MIVPFSILLTAGYTIFIWGCIVGAEKISENIFIQILIAAAALYIGHFIAIPMIRFLVQIIMTILSVLFAIPFSIVKRK